MGKNGENKEREGINDGEIFECGIIAGRTGGRSAWKNESGRENGTGKLCLSFFRNDGSGKENDSEESWHWPDLDTGHENEQFSGRGGSMAA